MQFPFTTEQFLNVFKFYNESVFPLQILFIVAAIYCTYLLFKNYKNGNKIINGILAFLWLWIGIVYQILFFSSINKAAYFFGIIFIIQGLIFLYYGIIKNQLVYNYQQKVINYIGFFFILYSLIIYPMLDLSFGHTYPYSPTFGLPCPTTIFTFGMFLFISKKTKVLFLILPFVWSIIGFFAAVKLSIYEDYGLLIAGIIGFGILLFTNNKNITILNNR